MTAPLSGPIATVGALHLITRGDTDDGPPDIGHRIGSNLRWGHFPVTHKWGQPVVVHVDANTLWCEHGQITDLPTMVHSPGNHAPCVHLIGPMPACILLEHKFVASLNFQPVVFARMRPPLIASRRGCLVEIAVSRLGHLNRCHRAVIQLQPDARWHYKLHAIQFDHEEEPAAGIWLAVR
jgi:hypothetical protein